MKIPLFIMNSLSKAMKMIKHFMKHSALENFSLRRGRKIKEKSLLFLLAQEFITYLMIIPNNYIALWVFKLLFHMCIHIL